MINLLKELGLDQGIYGGRSSGGGSGGTVVVLLKKNARSKLAELAKEVKFNDKPAWLIDSPASPEPPRPHADKGKHEPNNDSI